MKPNITTKERLSVIEEKLEQNAREHADIKQTLGNIDKKLDGAIACKADQSSVDSLSNKVWGIAIIFLTAFISLIVWIIQNNVR